MLYLVALLLPPVALLLAGKWLQFIINLTLCALAVLWIPLILTASVHAVLVIGNYYADKRAGRIVDAIHRRPPN